MALTAQVQKLWISPGSAIVDVSVVTMAPHVDLVALIACHALRVTVTLMLVCVVYPCLLLHGSSRLSPERGRTVVALLEPK